MKKNFKLIAGIIFLSAFYSVLLFISHEKADRLTREDGFIEDLSAVFWLLSSIILFYMYFRSKSDRRPYFLKAKRNIFYLLLALFFLVCFGEEISWGQRIFNLKTPELFEEDNAQHEINFHNLWVFQGCDRNNHLKPWIDRWTDSGRIFSLIWFGYCLLIPVAYKYMSKVHVWLDNIYFPIVPLWIGILFMVNYLISKVFEIFFPYTGNSQSPPIELKETNCAVLFLVVSIALFYIHRQLMKNISENTLQQ